MQMIFVRKGAWLLGISDCGGVQGVDRKRQTLGLKPISFLVVMRPEAEASGYLGGGAVVFGGDAGEKQMPCGNDKAKMQIPSLRYGMTEQSAKSRFPAGMTNERQMQIPSLRCGMTKQRATADSLRE
jgi:hypothetical protein